MGERIMSALSGLTGFIMKYRLIVAAVVVACAAVYLAVVLRERRTRTAEPTRERNEKQADRQPAIDEKQWRGTIRKYAANAQVRQTADDLADRLKRVLLSAQGPDAERLEKEVVRIDVMYGARTFSTTYPKVVALDSRFWTDEREGQRAELERWEYAIPLMFESHTALILAIRRLVADRLGRDPELKRCRYELRLCYETHSGGDMRYGQYNFEEGARYLLLSVR